MLLVAQIRLASHDLGFMAHHWKLFEFNLLLPPVERCRSASLSSEFAFHSFLAQEILLTPKSGA